MTKRATQNQAGRPSWSEGIVLFAAVGLLGAFMLPPSHVNPAMPNLAPLEPQARKDAFFEFLDPIVAAVNADVRRSRERLAEIAAWTQTGQPLRWRDRRYVRDLAAYYDVEFEDVEVEDALIVLRRRVDTVPPALVLVQAAKESGWGTSRFAVEGNNLFGQRCYEPGCGLRPRGIEDARFGVAAYDSVNQSVSEYLRNLNTHPEYFELRILRQSLRDRGEAPTGLSLADGLLGYSERGAAYVAEIKALIRQNELETDDTI